jgi:hypothetical protein
MFFAALDDRLAGAVPVCYVSSYQAHMGATACVGEIPTGVLRYTNQWEILGLHAPRPLLCIAASRDTPVFQPQHMFDALNKTKERVYSLYGAQERVRGAEVNSPHDYNRPMRELLYNHVAKYLQGVQNPHVVEPNDVPVESEETLRCGLPENSETVQSLTFKQAQKMVAAIPVPRNAAQWRKAKEDMLTRLRDVIFGGFPDAAQVRRSHVRDVEWNGHRVEHWTLETEPSVIVPAVLCLPKEATAKKKPAVLIVDEDGKKAAVSRGLMERLANAGFVSLAIDYRGAGETANTVPAYDTVPDYNLSNYSLFIGRPLAGMRVFDVRCATDFLAARSEVDRSRIAVIGRGMGAFTGTLAAAFDKRIAVVAAEEMLATWVFPEEFDNVGLSYLIPKILTVGDVEHLAACVAPRPLLMLNAVDGQRRPMGEETWKQTVRFTESVYRLNKTPQQFSRQRVEGKDVTERLVEWLKRNL